MNPYDFVRLTPGAVPQRRPAPRQDSFSGWTGQLSCTMTTLTPFFVPAAQHGVQFQRNGLGQHVVSGSSLKGLFRSLVETVAPGCWWLYDGVYESNQVDYGPKLPAPLRQCPQSGGLCPACRMFGLVADNALLVGRVQCTDAVASHIVEHSSVFTPILSTPKPRHDAWYLSDDGRQVRGRKFYFHCRPEDVKSLSRLVQTRSGQAQNARITPVGIGSVFAFRVHFTSLEDDELALLLYAIALEDGVRHKFGYAKPAGYGSVRLQVESLTRQRMSDRYSGQDGEAFTGGLLDAFVSAQTAPYRNDATITLQDLRRIWAWPARHTLQYPTQEWFDQHSQDPINSTP